MGLVNFVYVFLFCYISINGVVALSCLECDDLYKPHYCDIVATCAQGEECFIDQYVTSSGNALFKSGCRSTERCIIAKRQIADDVTNDVSSDIIVCTQCCNNTDYCNLEGCQEYAIPREQRGPYCFDCKKQTKGGCRHIKQCDVHYSSEITSEQLNNETVYDSQCVHSLSTPSSEITSEQLNNETVYDSQCVHSLSTPSSEITSEQLNNETVYDSQCVHSLSTPSCEITSEQLNNETVYDSQCVHSLSTPHCNASNVRFLPALVGKRDQSSVNCPVCCDDDFCNRECTSVHQVPVVNAHWSDWGTWSACSVTCGQGSRHRSRTCSPSSGNPCIGSPTQTENCGNACPVAVVNAHWSDWTTWSACSVTCGQGSRHRSRTCSPSSGKPCVGSPTQTENCGNSCPAPVVNAHWSDWGKWSACSVTCGQGSRQRSRTCSTSSGSPCAGNPTQTEKCGSVCPINGGYSRWSQWGACDVTCGHGNQIRTRLCNKPPPSNGGTGCVGDSADVRSCMNTPTCHASTFVVWSSWTRCSVTCGPIHGVTQRTKTCYDGSHHVNMSLCTQPLLEQKGCTPYHDCPAVNGGWTTWSQWNNCNTVCVQGYQERTRHCTNPGPQNGGKTCGGYNIDRKVCGSTHRCKDTDYSAWGPWSSCGHCCNTHWKSRSRTCNHGSAGHGNCQGPTKETIPCWTGVTNAVHQKVDGGWSPWGHYSRCSSSCSQGHKIRSRVCNRPAPQNGGQMCPGNRTQSIPCSNSCPNVECEKVHGYHLYTYKTQITSKMENAYLCLHYSTKMDTWFRASKICRQEGGKLAAFDAYNEDAVAFARNVHNAYPNSPHPQLWIGLQYSHNAWRWEDGAHIGYYARHKLGTNLNGVPAANLTGSACILDNGTTWSPEDCNHRHYYMCERIVD